MTLSVRSCSSTHGNTCVRYVMEHVIHMQCTACGFFIVMLIGRIKILHEKFHALQRYSAAIFAAANFMNGI